MRKISIILGCSLALSCGTSQDGKGPQKSPADLTGAPFTALCGNGVRDAGEQCDDGNTAPLDGCNATCGFEQVARANAATLQTGTPTLCTANALGAAISSAASQLQPQIDSAIKNGDMTLMIEVLGLTDLSGQSTQSTGVSLGVLQAAPVAGTSYDGTKDLDWWYTVAQSSVDANRAPLASMAATVTAAAKGSTTGAQVDAQGTIDVPLGLGGAVALLHMSGTKVRANVGAVSTPTESSAGTTPGHLANEHLDPALTSFASITNGQMCGNVSAASLAAIAIPSMLLPGNGITSCGGFGTPAYAANNTLLDVLVNGCSVAGGFVKGVAATQPDQTDPGQTAVGAGGPYKLTSDASFHVNGCADKNGKSVDLQSCLSDAAYSASLTFTMDRVIAQPPAQPASQPASLPTGN